MTTDAEFEGWLAPLHTTWKGEKVELLPETVELLRSIPRDVRESPYFFYVFKEFEGTPLRPETAALISGYVRNLEHTRQLATTEARTP